MQWWTVRHTFLGNGSLHIYAPQGAFADGRQIVEVSKATALEGAVNKQVYFVA